MNPNSQKAKECHQVCNDYSCVRANRCMGVSAYAGMTKAEIEEARTAMKGIFADLAQAGVLLGKPAEQIASVVSGPPVLVDALCDLAIKGLSNGPSDEALQAFLNCPCVSHELAALQSKYAALKSAAPQQSKGGTGRDPGPIADGAAPSEAGAERLPADVVPFIRHVTLELQSHRSRTPKQMDALFQQAYRLYYKYQVDYSTDPEHLHGVARQSATDRDGGSNG